MTREAGKFPAGGEVVTDTQPPVVVPPVLYLPAREHPEGGAYPEIRKLRDGRSALLAYTALDRLADACGSEQAWILVHTSELGDIRARQPYDVVAFDPQLPSALLAGGKLA